jgi:hypothetical protein
VAPPRGASLRPQKLEADAANDTEVHRRRSREVAQALPEKADIRALLSLAKYERASEDDYGQRIVVNGLALVVTVALIATGILLASNLHD